MTEPFEATHFSIAWAKDHITELKREADLFLSDKSSCAYVTEPDPDGPYKLLKFKLRKTIPRPIRGHARDAVINLRAALDQAICSVFFLCGLPTLDRYFPFARTQANFENALNGRCGQLPQDIRHVVCLCEPYKGGNPLLWALNELAGTNKHGILRPVVGANTLVEASGRGGGVQILCEPQWDRDKDEIVLARIPIEDFTNPQFQMNYQAAFFIAFDEVEFVKGCEVIATLDEFAYVVEGIVTAIEDEARRISLF